MSDYERPDWMSLQRKYEAQKKLMDQIEQRRMMDRARLNMQFHQPGSRRMGGNGEVLEELCLKSMCLIGKPTGRVS